MPLDLFGNDTQYTQVQDEYKENHTETEYGLTPIIAGFEDYITEILNQQDLLNI